MNVRTAGLCPEDPQSSERIDPQAGIVEADRYIGHVGDNFETRPGTAIITAGDKQYMVRRSPFTTATAEPACQLPKKHRDYRTF